MSCFHHHHHHHHDDYYDYEPVYAPPAYRTVPTRDAELRRLEDERELLERRLRRLERDLADLRGSGRPAETRPAGE